MIVAQGGEPRRSLIPRVVSGAKQIVTAVFSSRVSVDSGAGPRRSPPVPATRITFASRVRFISAEGDAHYEFSIDSADLLVQPGTPQAIVDELASRLSFLNGLSGAGRAGPRGNSLDLELPKALPPERRKELLDVAAALRFAKAPFPVEPIGPGAQWEEFVGAQDVKGRAAFELVSFDGSRVATRFLAQQTSRDRPLPPEYRTPGARGERMEVRAETKGEAVFGLDRIWPLRSASETRVQEDFSTEPGEPLRRMRIVSEMRMELEEKSP